MKYRLVQQIDNDWIVSEFDDEAQDILECFIVRGYAMIGRNINPSQRAELQGAPKFAGLCGPMWDRDAIRYECPVAYRALSA